MILLNRLMAKRDHYRHLNCDWVIPTTSLCPRNRFSRNYVNFYIRLERASSNKFFYEIVSSYGYELNGKYLTEYKLKTRSNTYIYLIVSNDPLDKIKFVQGNSVLPITYKELDLVKKIINGRCHV